MYTTSLPICTVVYFLRGVGDRREILFGTKAARPKSIKWKTAGKLIGYGGCFESRKDRSIAACATRELREESNFKVKQKDLELVARISILDENGPKLTLHYYFVRTWKGTAGVSNEVLDPQWHPTSHLPGNMLGSDPILLPMVLKGKKVEGSVTYDKDMKVVQHDLVCVKSLG